MSANMYIYLGEKTQTYQLCLEELQVLKLFHLCEVLVHTHNQIHHTLWDTARDLQELDQELCPSIVLQVHFLLSIHAVSCSLQYFFVAEK